MFKHAGITWEWVIVIVASAFFFGGIECWEWGNRLISVDRNLVVLLKMVSFGRISMSNNVPSLNSSILPLVVARLSPLSKNANGYEGAEAP